jgi:S-adenosylmethionine uptake transporter
MLLATVLMSGVHAIGHDLSKDIHPLQLMFFRVTLQFVILLPFFIKDWPAVIKTTRLKDHAWRNIFGVVSMAMWFYGIAHLPLSNAVTLSFAAPIFTTIIAAIWLHEKVHYHRWIATLIGFAGVLLVARPDTAGFNWVAMLVIFQALLVAIANFLIKSLTSSESNMTILFYMGVFMIPLSILPAAYVWVWPSLTAWGWLLLMGGASGLAHYGLTRAFQLSDASALMPLDYLRLPLAIATDMALFAFVPDAYTWAGATTIAASCLYILHRERLHRRRISDVTSLPR